MFTDSGNLSIKNLNLILGNNFKNFSVKEIKSQMRKVLEELDL